MFASACVCVSVIFFLLSVSVMATLVYSHCCDCWYCRHFMQVFMHAHGLCVTPLVLVFTGCQ